MHNVSWFYEFGVGTDKDYEKAGAWLAKEQEITDEKLYYGEGSSDIIRLLTDDLESAEDLSEEFCEGFYEAIWVRKQNSSLQIAMTGHITLVMASLYPEAKRFWIVSIGFTRMSLN